MNILVSACLLGVSCRYDGKSKEYEGIRTLMQYANLIPFCPEIYGGLATPRPPAEIKNDLVITNTGTDVTACYNKGAQEALRIAGLYGCTCALLKERSPSCGSGTIHDGSFSGALTDGNGITAGLLARHGIRLFGETRINELITMLQTDE